MNEKGNQDAAQEKLLFVLSSLEDMGEVLTDGIDFDASAKYLLRLLLGTTGVTRGVLYVYNASDEQLLHQTSNTIGNSIIGSVSLSSDLARRVALDSVPHLIDTMPRYLINALQPMHSFWEEENMQVMIPLAVKNDLLGLVYLGNKFMKQAYDPSDLEVLRLLCQHISLYFYNQRLLHETKKANFRLNKKILEMEQLFEVGLAITRLKSLDELTFDILARATSILDARFGAFWELQNQCYQLRASFGFDHIGVSFPSIMPDYHGCTPDNHPEQIGLFTYCLSIPMTFHSEHIGILVVAGKETRDGHFSPFSDDDAMLLASFANQAAVAFENSRLYHAALEKERLDRELEVAVEIQQSLLPWHYPQSIQLDIAANTIPCRCVGGDFYDFIELCGGQIGIVIADVSGKGIPAAMLVSTFHAALHAIRHTFEDPISVAEHLNQLLAEKTPENKFITAAFILWNPETKTITSVSAGHEPAILLRKDGTSTLLGQGGIVLGLLPDVKYYSETVSFLPGDVLCLYTDGITDLRNPMNQQFGIDRLKTLLTKASANSACDILENIFHSLNLFADSIPASDDQTLLIVHCREP